MHIENDRKDSIRESIASEVVDEELIVDELYSECVGQEHYDRHSAKEHTAL